MLLLPLEQGPAPEGPTLWANSMSLLGPERFRCSGREGLALDLRVTTMMSPRVAAPGWWPTLPVLEALGSLGGRSSLWRSRLT